jgi:hypothetical protein
MTARRWFILILAVVLVAGAVTLYALPGIVRRVAVARVEAMTGRPAAIDAVDLDLFRGRFTVRGFRLAERDGTTPFADIARIDAHLHLLSLLRGHLWIRDLVLSDSTVRVVRLPTNEFNFSDLLGKSETTGKRLDVTVDHFAVKGGKATLEDRAVPETRTWTSEQMTIDAYNLSTLKDGGTAVATSVTAGAPVSIEVTNLRLHPILLHATATVEGLDVTPAQVYFPPDIQFRIDRGRLSTKVTIALDASDGIRADATGRMEDVVLVRADGSDRLAHVPKMTGQVTGFALRDGAFRLERLVTDGTMAVRDPTANARAAFLPSSVRASIADLTWPATTPGRVDVQATVPGGGTLTVLGTVRPPPAATQLNVRAANVNLAAWAQFLPVATRVTGTASADLRMNEPFAAGVPARVQGMVAVDRLAVADERQEVLRAQRVEASGLELHWPTRVVVRRVVVTSPRAAVERDRGGSIVMPFGMGGGGDSKASSGVGGVRDAPSSGVGGVRGAPPKPPTSRAAATIPIAVAVGEVVVRDGSLAWRDESVMPAARLEFANIDASVAGAGWPLEGPLNLRVALRPPGGGQLRASGRVGLEPMSADLRVNANNAELAPYQSYLPTTARVSGAADLDLAVVVPSLADRRATARGTASLSRVDVRDGQRTVLRAERATATGLDVDWPERIAVGRLALARPWLLLERDDKGALPLRALVPGGGSGPPGKRAPGGTSAQAENSADTAQPLIITVARLAADDGGMRVVDRAISPAFAVDLDAATLRMEGISTAAAPPAKLDLSARVAGKADLELRGTVDALEGPFRLDVNGELREFAVPRANSYLVNQVGWKSVDGRLTAKLRARVDGDALAAKTDIRVSRLRLVKAGEQDQAQARIGLPLGMITSLMKDRRGDINVSFPVGGRLSDPRFDFRETMWTAVRTIAINAITLPVSRIGRVQFSPDSKIQKVQVDPLPFEPGAAVLTAEGQARVARLKAFFDELPDVRMALIPVVSSRDVAEIQRRTAPTAFARDGRPSGDGAALPRAAVQDRPPVAASAVSDLASRRLAAVREAFKHAGIDTGRLTETKVAERPGGETHVELEILEPEGERPSKVRDMLRRLGVPLKGADD